MAYGLRGATLSVKTVLCDSLLKNSMPDLASLLGKGTLIKLMGWVGAIWIGVVLIMAAQSPTTSGQISLSKAARQVEGFDLTFPPRPAPDLGLLRHSDGKVFPKGAVQIVQFHPAACRDCPAAERQLSGLRAALPRPDLRVAIVKIGQPAEQEPTAGAIPVFPDPQAQFASYLTRQDHPMTVIYAGDQEIGRAVGPIDLSTTDGLTLINAIFAEKTAF